MRGTFLLPLILLAACDDNQPKKAEAAKVVSEHPGAATMWPALLQHCLRAPSCDPGSNFGQGVGQASGVAGSVAWFVESKDVVKEGGQDYGAAITLSMFGPRGTGGAGGRPLTLDESPNSLHGTNARRSRLYVEYRTPGGGPPEPYTLSFQSAQIVVAAPGVEQAKSQEDIASLTSKYFDNMHWGAADDFDKTGVKIEFGSKTGGVLYTGYSMGIASGEYVTKAEALKRGFEPWFFYVSRNIRDEPLPAMMKAFEKGEPLTMKITRLGGDLLLEDGIYVDGYAEALKQATAALADPLLNQPFTQRCVGLTGKSDEFWLKPEIAPVLFSCDPRTLQQRQTAEAIAAQKVKSETKGADGASPKPK